MSSRVPDENKSVLDPSGTASTPGDGRAFESRRARRAREAQAALADAHSAGVADIEPGEQAVTPAGTEFLSRRERRLASQQKSHDLADALPTAPVEISAPQSTRRSRCRAQTEPVAIASNEPVTDVNEPVVAETVIAAEPEATPVADDTVVIEPDAVPTTTESFEEIIAGAFPVEESSIPDDESAVDEHLVADEAPASDNEPETAEREPETPKPEPAAARRGRHGASSTAPVESARAPRSIRRIAAKTMSVSALLAVGLMTVATSVPANALLSADEVQAQKRLAQTGQEYPITDAQSMVNTASADVPLHRDTYGALSATQAAASLGINPEDTFTNDPNGTVQWPFSVGVHIGSGYGPRAGCAIGCSTNHMGQDFNPGYGAPIQSIADGVVVESTDAGGAFGVKIVIEHVIDGQMIHSLYGHMIPGSRTVQVGDHVSVGQIIGKTGSTGISTGAHLHLEILINGTRHVDPLAWLYENTN